MRWFISKFVIDIGKWIVGIKNMELVKLKFDVLINSGYKMFHHY